jgi:hypothetical protein
VSVVLAPDAETVRPLGVSVATISLVAAALLVYVAGSFLVAELMGIKRELEGLLLMLVAVAASYFLVSRPERLFNPLVLFALIKLAVEIGLRRDVLFALDGLATVLALVVVVAAPARSFEVAARSLVVFAGVFALMGLVQWTMLAVDPQLSRFVLQVGDDDEHMNLNVQHPVAVLGIVGDAQYSLFGHSLARMQSFAKEPSLNVVYFMLPAARAFLLGSGAMMLWGSIIMAFCVLSLSGSVFLSLAFSGVWWVLLRFVPIRLALPYGMLGLLAVFLAALFSFGSDPLLDAFTYLAQYGDFLNKTESLTSRTGGAITSATLVLTSPLGSETRPDIPGPMLINAALGAGWFGVVLLLVFFRRLGRQLEAFSASSRPASARRIGVYLFIGSIATVLVFNDYQMNNYAGLIQLAFIYRLITSRNSAESPVKVLR